MLTGDHVELIGAIALDRPAEQAEAGIVDDVLHFQAGRGQSSAILSPESGCTRSQG
jgi:hypothetical protein